METPQMQIWILTGLTLAMSTVLFSAFKSSMSLLVKKIETLVSEVCKLTKEVVVHNHRIRTLEDRIKEQRLKTDKHADWIRKIEIKKNG